MSRRVLVVVAGAALVAAVAYAQSAKVEAVSLLCTYGEATRLSLATTATAIPSALVGRTAITLVNASSGATTGRIACRMGGAPTCNAPGTGMSLFPSGGSVRFAIPGTVAVQCIACGSSALNFEYLEESCTAL